MSPPTPHDSISRSQLAAWGLLDQVVRIETMDILLSQQPALDKQELEQLTTLWCQQKNIKSQEELEQWCQHYGLNLQQWQQLIMRPRQWLHWCEQEFKDKIKTHFLKRKSHLDRVTYSLIRVKDEDLAWELFHRIKEDRYSFQELAKAHSQGPERHSGGLLGPVPLSQPHPHLSELLRISEPGKLWQPKKLEGWWVIVRLEHRHGARFNDLNEHLSLELGELHLNALMAQSKPDEQSGADKSSSEQSGLLHPLASLHLLNRRGFKQHGAPKQHSSEGSLPPPARRSQD